MTDRPLPGDPAWLRAAFSRLGVSEISGAKHEKKVLEMYAASGHPEIKNDETAWCAAYVGWALKQAGLPNTGSLMARSYAKYGRKLSTSAVIPRGAICVWPRGKPPSGHVNFCLSDSGQFITCIGGNQNNKKGGGVTVSKYRKSSLVAAVWPIEPKPEPEPEQPDIEPPDDAPKPTQPDDPGPEPAAVPVKLPWHKKVWAFLKSKWTWVAGGLFGGGITIGSVDITAEMILALCVLLIVLGGLAYGVYRISKKEAPDAG